MTRHQRKQRRRKGGGNTRNAIFVGAGVLLALDGLLPPATGARVTYTDGKATVTDGPFAEAKEVIGGYWILEVRSRAEAIEWARRAPMGNNEIIEVRQIHEMADFPEDVQKAAEGFDQITGK